MRGAPARAIQELAGNRDLATTQRYMHLSPAACERECALGGEPGRNRTFNPQIKSLLLCQLSYWPTGHGSRQNDERSV
jgi:hypothetical protein